MGIASGAAIVDRLDPVDPAERARLLASLRVDGAHAAAMAALPSFQQIEVGGACGDGRSGDTFEVVAWNLQRGTDLGAAADIVQRRHPDVILASELDVGMARTGNRHTAADLADRLGHTYAFAVEFLELGLGDAAEATRLGAHATNELGFHGNAITARSPLRDPILIRIEDGGSWFNPETDEPRVGGRMALAAQVELDGRPVVVCSLHLESESDPSLRAEQLGAVLEAIDAHYGRVASIVGGDLNTFSAGLDDVRTHFRALRDEDPRRFCWPVPYEPLFDIAAGHGFDVDGPNEAEQTMRLAADQRAGSLLRLDWLLVRDLDVTDRSTIPAIGPEQVVISDHDAVAATLRHPTGSSILLA
jgi:endonuclease/exonuclease/phosphatase family metal-dependent hydrolase